MPKQTAKLLIMPEAQQAELAELLLGGLSYAKAKQFIAEKWGINASNAGLNQFWDEVCAPAVIVRRRRAAGLAHEVADEARKNPAKFDEATIELLEQYAFDLAHAPERDPKAIASIFSLLLTRQKQSEEMKTGREKGLAALAGEARGNPAAEAALDALIAALDNVPHSALPVPHSP